MEKGAAALVAEQAVAGAEPEAADERQAGGRGFVHERKIGSDDEINSSIPRDFRLRSGFRKGILRRLTWMDVQKSMTDPHP
jgi:hypothetical protein